MAVSPPAGSRRRCARRCRWRPPSIGHEDLDRLRRDFVLRLRSSAGQSDDHRREARIRPAASCHPPVILYRPRRPACRSPRSRAATNLSNSAGFIGIGSSASCASFCSIGRGLQHLRCRSGKCLDDGARRFRRHEDAVPDRIIRIRIAGLHGRRNVRQARRARRRAHGKRRRAALRAPAGSRSRSGSK